MSTRRTREIEAEQRLAAIGELENARRWLQKDPPPKGWPGTPLEYAELEMPCGVFGSILRLLGMF